VAKRSWSFAANVAMACLPEVSALASSLSLAVKNQSGARSSSNYAVIGRGCAFSTPSRPSITVLSDRSAFQNFSLISTWLVMLLTLEVEVA
jgi:hypothetical protein